MTLILSFLSILLLAIFPLITIIHAPILPTRSTTFRHALCNCLQSLSGTSSRLPQTALPMRKALFHQTSATAQKSHSIRGSQFPKMPSGVSESSHRQLNPNLASANVPNPSIIEALKAAHEWKEGFFEIVADEDDPGSSSKGFLGRGVSGTCYKAKRKDSTVFSVLKEINEKDKNGHDSKPQILREIENNSAVDSPFVRQIRHWFEDKKAGKVIIEMEYIENDFANLYYSLKKFHMGEAPRTFTWELTRYYISQIVEAIIAMNEKGIIHRDIKPGNFLLTKNQKMKLADFGHSLNTNLEETEPYDSEFHYIAPEAKSPGYGKKVDVYSLGVTMYEMLSTKHFNEKEPDFESVPMPARELLRSMLKANPEERCDIHHVKRFLNMDWDAYLKDPSSPSEMIPKAPVTIDGNFYVINTGTLKGNIEKLSKEEVQYERMDELQRFENLLI